MISAERTILGQGRAAFHTPHDAAQYSGSAAAWSAPPCRATMGPEIRHRMALLPGGATKQWLGLVLNVCLWHKADMLNALTNVRFWGQSGQ